MASPIFVKASLYEIFSLHNQRMLAYKELDNAFKIYLTKQDGPNNEANFQIAIAQATARFQEISNSVLREKTTLSSSSIPTIKQLVQLVDKIQHLESQRLKLTVEYQLFAGKCKDDYVAMGDSNLANNSESVFVDDIDHFAQIGSVVKEIEDLIVALREEGEEFLMA